MFSIIAVSYLLILFSIKREIIAELAANIDTSFFYLKEESIKEEKADKVDELKEYQEMRDRERADELKRLREENKKVKFTSVKPLRKDPNRGMHFVCCTEPINKGKLGSSRSFIKKKDKEYY